MSGPNNTNNNINKNTKQSILSTSLLSPASPYTANQHNLARILTASSPIPSNYTTSTRFNNAITIRENTARTSQNLKNTNRHTIAESNDILKYDHQQSFESSNNNSSPLSKTPDSSNENWLTLTESLLQQQGKQGSDSFGTLGDSDHEIHDSNATGLSLGGDESADDDLDSGFHNSSLSGNNYLFCNDDNDDHTTKRLKTFVATTLHNERVYLDKLKKLLNFRVYLEESFNGSETDLSVLFSGIQQIYTTHDIVAYKLQEYLTSLTDLLITSSNNTRLNQAVGSSRHATNLSSSNALMKENFLSSALQLLANIMEISFPVYFEFLKNYPKSMTILNKLEKQSFTSSKIQNSKRKTFNECQVDYNAVLMAFNSDREESQLILNEKKKSGFLARLTMQKYANSAPKDPFDIYYNDVKKSEDVFDLTRIFTEDILRRPTKLFEFIYSLKDECILASNELPNNYCIVLQSNIKSLFENEASKNLREKVFNEINRNIMPKEVRKNEDVVEFTESNNDRKLRHLILYGDCLVCCRLKKDKRQLKWFIPIDHLEVFTDEYTTAKSDDELRHLKEEVVSLRGNLRKQTEENASAKNQQKIKKKLAEQENELAIQSSRLRLIVRANPSIQSSSSNSASTQSFFSNGGSLAAAISSSVNNLANLTGSSSSSSRTTSSSSANTSVNYNYHQHNQFNYYSSSISTAQANLSHSSITSPTQTSFSSSSTYVFMFTSDFERNAWLEEINGAVYAYIEARINSLKKIEEPPKVITSSYTGSLELLVKKIENLEQPNKVYVAVELKSCGSYLEVAQTRCSDLTKNPVWDEKFNLELQSVDSLRIILYSQTSSKALSIASQELKIDSNVNLNKINCVKLTNGISLHISMKFLSPKKTITRRRTRNRNDIFGGNLNDLLQREKSTIPRILKDCVEVIETKGIEEIGIYRVSSVVSEVQKMKDFYSKNPTQALNELRQKSPHLSANVLKLYLRELPDPLFTSQLYHRFMNAMDCQVHEFRLGELCRVFNELPDANKNIILFVLTHLLNIASYSDKNMMNLKNLCTLFGPTLMKLSPKDNLQVEDMNKEINESMQQAQVLFYILQLHSEGKLMNDPTETHFSTSKTDNNDVSQIDNKMMDNFTKLNMNNKINQPSVSNGIGSGSGQGLDSNNNSISSNQQKQQTQTQNSSFTKMSMQTAL